MLEEYFSLKSTPEIIYEQTVSVCVVSVVTARSRHAGDRIM